MQQNQFPYCYFTRQKIKGGGGADIELDEII